MGRRLLQSGTAFLLQSGTGVVTKWGRCNKVRRILLQSGTSVTEWDGCCYKVGQVLQSGTNFTKWAVTKVLQKALWSLKKML